MKTPPGQPASRHRFALSAGGRKGRLEDEVVGARPARREEASR